MKDETFIQCHKHLSPSDPCFHASHSKFQDHALQQLLPAQNPAFYVKSPVSSLHFTWSTPTFFPSHNNLCPRGYTGYPLSPVPCPEMFQLASLEEQCQPDNPQKGESLCLCQKKQLWHFPFLLMISNTEIIILNFEFFLKKEKNSKILINEVWKKAFVLLPRDSLIQPSIEIIIKSSYLYCLQEEI